MNDLSRPEGAQGVRFELNGQPCSLTAPLGERLSDALRERLGLTGTKVGCSAGDCGACTVLLDDEQVCACLVAVGQVQGRRVVTVEGLARDGHLSKLQQAFLETGAAQCGICIPGMLVALYAFLGEHPAATRAQIREAIGGNLCRCTGYHKIVDAAEAAARALAAR